MRRGRLCDGTRSSGDARNFAVKDVRETRGHSRMLALQTLLLIEILQAVNPRLK